MVQTVLQHSVWVITVTRSTTCTEAGRQFRPLDLMRSAHVTAYVPGLLSYTSSCVSASGDGKRCRIPARSLEVLGRTRKLMQFQNQIFLLRFHGKEHQTVVDRLEHDLTHNAAECDTNQCHQDYSDNMFTSTRQYFLTLAVLFWIWK